MKKKIDTSIIEDILKYCMTSIEIEETVHLFSRYAETELCVLQPIIDYVQILYDTEMSFKCTDILTSLILLKRYEESLINNNKVNLETLLK